MRTVYGNLLHTTSIRDCFDVHSNKILAEAATRPPIAAGLLRELRALCELEFIICATWLLIRWIDRIRLRNKYHAFPSLSTLEHATEISGIDSFRVASLPEFELGSGGSAGEHVAVLRNFFHLL